jgi:hypothetical protein
MARIFIVVLTGKHIQAVGYMWRKKRFWYLLEVGPLDFFRKQHGICLPVRIRRILMLAVGQF